MTISRLPLSYCTNVHPGRTVQDVIAGLNEHTAVAARMLNQPIAAGLWFSANVTDELTRSVSALEELAQALWENDLTCCTLNTFPFGDFHSDRVKEQVYLPDWSDPRRLQYTRSCSQLLSQLLPPDAEGSLSTLPLGGTMNPVAPDFHARCIDQLLSLAADLDRVFQESGRRIRLGIEPEPHCHLSSTARQVLPFFESLFAAAAQRGVEAVAREYLGICFDVCHQSVEFEDVAQSIAAIDAAGIRLNKIHITNAVELKRPADNPEGRTALLRFVEPRYLHQTFAEFADGTIASRVDLTGDDITRLPPDAFLKAVRWRVHFHVPVDADELGPLKTTKPDLRAALNAVRLLSYAPHLEVETYTWPVMPGEAGAAETALAHRIARELAAAQELTEA